MPGFEAAGVGARKESAAESAGEGIVAAAAAAEAENESGPVLVGMAMRGEGATIPPCFVGDASGVFSDALLPVPMSLPSTGVIGVRPLLESPVELAGLFPRRPMP